MKLCTVPTIVCSSGVLVRLCGITTVISFFAPLLSRRVLERAPKSLNILLSFQQNAPSRHFSRKMDMVVIMRLPYVNELMERDRPNGVLSARWDELGPVVGIT